MNFSYILDKIDKADVLEHPFRHIEIHQLFEEQDFKRIVGSADVFTRPAENDEALFDELFSRNYRIIDFPGCTSDHREYVKWHKERGLSHKTNTSCEGFGVVLRLGAPQSEEIQTLQAFMQSQPFIDAIARKFGIDPAACNYDAGIQKYLDGYEISPHPDIRRKALTYMVNINPNPNASAEDYHTSYLRFRPKWDYVQSFWAGNPNVDRCWVPWDWCDTIKQQTSNNSIVIFAPGDDTLHAVKAKYNHLSYQRTQMYGNLWFKEDHVTSSAKWEDYVIGVQTGTDGLAAGDSASVKSYFKRVLPPGIKNILKKADSALLGSRRDKRTHADRTY